VHVGRAELEEDVVAVTDSTEVGEALDEGSVDVVSVEDKADVALSAEVVLSGDEMLVSEEVTTSDVDDEIELDEAEDDVVAIAEEEGDSSLQIPKRDWHPVAQYALVVPQ
jgi:hypothetical protein